jgi:hypothetical protein
MHKPDVAHGSLLRKSNPADSLREVPSQSESWQEISPNPDIAVQASDLAHYIAHMTGSMAHMARGAHLDSLAYFLEMATIEARTLIKKSEHPY